MGGQDREVVLGPVGQGGGPTEGWYRERKREKDVKEVGGQIFL